MRETVDGCWLIRLRQGYSESFRERAARQASDGQGLEKRRTPNVQRPISKSLTAERSPAVALSRCISESCRSFAESKK